MGKREKRRKAERIRRAHRVARAELAAERARQQAGAAPTGKSADVVLEPVDVTLLAPAKFCLLTEPEETLDFLKTFDSVLARPEVTKIVVNFSECKVMSLCAFSVLFTRFMDTQQARESVPITLLGIRSGSTSVNQMIGFAEVSEEARPVNIIRSPMIRGKAVGNAFSKERDRAGTEIVDHLTKCLATVGTELTPEGRKYIGNLITEAVGNAEEHSGPWVASGYFVQQYATDPGECHLVLFNSGATICERIQSPDASEKIRARAEQLAAHHLNKGFFTGRLRNNWNKEAL